MKFNSYSQACCLLASLTALSAASPLSVDRLVALAERAGLCAPGICNEPVPHVVSSGAPPPVVSSSAPPPATSTPAPPPTSAPAPAPAPSVTDGRQQPDPTLSIARAAMTPYLYACSKDQQAVVQKAWDEANVLAQSHVEWQPSGWFTWPKWQDAMDLYIGTDSKSDNGWFGSTGPLKENVLRQSGIHVTDGNYSPYWSYTYMYCDESQLPHKPGFPAPDECGRPNNPGKRVAAYTFADDGSIFGWNAKYVVLCPRFFDSDILTLAEMTAKAKQDTSLARIMDNWRKVKARVMFHETYHWSPEVSIPAAAGVREIYDPAGVVQLAKTGNAAQSRLNAESWAQAALAIYLQKTFGLDTPPVPMSMAAEQGISTQSSESGDDLEEKWLSAPPDGFVPPVALDAASFSPDMANVVRLNGTFELGEFLEGLLAGLILEASQNGTSDTNEPQPA